MAEIQTLIEMGFPKERAEKALAVTNYKGVEPAMEWLLAHADEPDVPDVGPGQTLGGNSSTNIEVTPAASEPNTESSEVAKSFKCDECGKLFKNQDEMEFHAAKTNHSSFSESTEEKKPLTEEEKKAQLALLEERMKQKRKEREEKEKPTGASFSHQKLKNKRKLHRRSIHDQSNPFEFPDNEFLRLFRMHKDCVMYLCEELKEALKPINSVDGLPVHIKAEALERERLRIKSGKDLQDVRQRLQEQEMQKLVEQRRREKIEDQKARERVRAQIEADKQARKLAALGRTEAPAPLPAAAAPAPSPAPTPAPIPAAAYEQARIQLRLPDGNSLAHTFGAKEQLAAVRLYLQMHAQEFAQQDNFKLMTTFPKKVFTSDDYEKPLESLGLVPSAVIIVSRGQ